MASATQWKQKTIFEVKRKYCDRKNNQMKVKNRVKKEKFENGVN